MAKLKREEGFFIHNSKPFKSDIDFEKNALNVEDSGMEYAVDKEIKYIPALGEFCIDADTKEATQYMEGWNSKYKVTPYKYNTSSVDRNHYWYKVDDVAQEVINKLKLNSSASKIEPGIDTRGTRTTPEGNLVQGAVYLKRTGKDTGGRPLPMELIEGIEKTTQLPIIPILPAELRQHELKSGTSWSKESLRLASKVKGLGLSAKVFDRICREWAAINGDKHNEQECRDKFNFATAHTAKTTKGSFVDDLYYYNDFTYLLKDGKFHLLSDSELERLIMYNLLPPGKNSAWTRSLLSEKRHLLHLGAEKIPTITNKIVFSNGIVYDWDENKVVKTNDNSMNRVSWEYKTTHSSHVKKIHEDFMSGYGWSNEKRLGMYLNIGMAMMPMLATRDIVVNIGTAHTGKSAMLDFIEHVVGEGNASAVTFEQLQASDHMTYMLEHKTVNIVGDASSEYTKAVDIIKKASAGDNFMANPKGKSPYMFRPYALIMLNVNGVMRWADDDGSGALEERLKFFVFDQIMPKDHNFKNKYFTKEHAEYVIFLAVEALKLFKDEKIKAYCDQGPMEEFKMNDMVYRYYIDGLSEGEFIPFKRHVPYGQDESKFNDEEEYSGSKYGTYRHYRWWLRMNGLHTFVNKFRFDDKMAYYTKLYPKKEEE